MMYMINLENFMIRYCYVDTCVLSDILIQYNPINPLQSLEVSRFIKPNMLREINRAIESSGYEGMIITSSFAFIELINKFNDIFGQTKVQPYTIANFIKQPPQWITIEEVGNATSLSLCDVPQYTPLLETISGDDAIHIATAISRGEHISFCTTDLKIKQLSIGNIVFLTD